jgi:hypothetical protein
VCGISQLLFNESLIAAMQLEKRGKKIKEKETFRPTPGPEEYAAADGGIIISEKALEGGWMGGQRRRNEACAVV